jgi:5-methylcytosine-specific restriction endonuclease McrA
MRTRADSPTLNCSEQGCDGALRARGLCSTHYNQQHQPERHRLRTVACVVCGAQMQRRTQRYERVVCSVPCRNVVCGNEGDGQYDWAIDAARRASDAGALIVEVFDRIDVFTRDKWTCRICFDPVDSTLDPLHPMSPSVDHIVPLSRGGEHSLANAQTTHLRCNAAKSDRLLVTLSH